MTMTAGSQLPDCDYADGTEDASKCNSSKCARHASPLSSEPEHLPMEIAFRDVTVSLGALQRLSRERDNAIAALVYLGHGDTASKVIAGTYVPPQAAKPPAAVPCTCVCSDCLAKTAVHPFCRYSCKLTERFTCNHEPQCATGSSHQARLHTDKEAARSSEFASFAGSKFEDVLATTDGKPLVDALSDIATWENERAVAQALRGNRDPHTGALWDTCFRHIFSELLKRREAQSCEGLLTLAKAVADKRANPAAVDVEAWAEKLAADSVAAGEEVFFIPPTDGAAPPPPLGTNELRACWCFFCLDYPEAGADNPTLHTPIVCPACRNKRCPRASDHRYACTDSNAPGQFGSRFEHEDDSEEDAIVARIVRWLRAASAKRLGDCLDSVGSGDLLDVADGLEQGDWKRASFDRRLTEGRKR